MKSGKVSQAVLERSVLRQIGNEACAQYYEPVLDEEIVFSSNPATGVYSGISKYALCHALNDIAAKSANPIGVTVNALYPPDIDEKEIARDAKAFGIFLKQHQLQAFGGHTEVTSAVTRPLFSLTAIGSRKKGYMPSVKAGHSLILTGTIAIEGTAVLSHLKEEELRAHFPSFIIEQAQSLEDELSILDDVKVAGAYASSMKDLSQGGIFGALWEYAEENGLGLEVDLKQIPIRQETVEICDYLGANPYELLSGGGLLFTTNKPEDALRAMKAAGISAAVIGTVTDSKDRIVRSGEEVRYLDRAKPDEINRFI